MTGKRWRVVGINFDHMHMGDLLREVHEHPDAEIVGICDKNAARMSGAITAFGIPADKVFTDAATCMASTRPDMAHPVPGDSQIMPAPWKRWRAIGADILVEKPFAASLGDADRMIAAADKSGVRLAINWPLAWYPPHVTSQAADRRRHDRQCASKCISTTAIAARSIISPTRSRSRTKRYAEPKPTSWWYKARIGGGSLLDYLGYGATLGTWYMGGRAPLAVTVDRRPARRASRSTSIRSPSAAMRPACRNSRRDGARSATRGHCSRNRNAGSWWSGTDGTISSYDFEQYVGVQTQGASRDPKRRRGRVGGAVSQAGGIRAALQADRRADRRTAQPRPLPHGAADHRYLGHVGKAETHAGPGGMTQSDKTSDDLPAPIPMRWWRATPSRLPRPSSTTRRRCHATDRFRSD